MEVPELKTVFELSSLQKLDLSLKFLQVMFRREEFYLNLRESLGFL
ncbi:Uncharacterised protein [Legionella busanensis]|uniref:Uncharacterized protein n=1 Tax=Legionella busanensis TaxID=190655 RepID=A0A378JL86_9GAMM|nr:Uncharacterised protein [Legionella busanensis]